MVPAAVMPTMMPLTAPMMTTVVIVAGRRMVMVVPVSAPVSGGSPIRVWRRAISRVGRSRAVVEGLGAGWDGDQQAQCDGDGGPAHDGFVSHSDAFRLARSCVGRMASLGRHRGMAANRTTSRVVMPSIHPTPILKPLEGRSCP